MPRMGYARKLNLEAGVSNYIERIDVTSTMDRPTAWGHEFLAHVPDFFLGNARRPIDR